MNITRVKEIWNYLEVTHEGTNEIKNRKINMHTQDFESIRLLPNESIDEIFNWLKSITNNLQSHGKVITCFEMNNKALRSPMEYNSIINPIEIYMDINTLPFQELMGILKNAEIKMNLQKKKAR